MGYKPILPTRVTRRGHSLCSSLRVFAALATPKGYLHNHFVGDILIVLLAIKILLS